MPAAGAGETLHAGLHATDRNSASRGQQPRILPSRHVQEFLQSAKIRPSRCEADHGNAIIAGDVPLYVAYTHACAQSVDPIIAIETSTHTIRYIAGRSLRRLPEYHDIAYDFVASIRYRLFARPKEACPMLPPDLRSRFDLHL